MGIASILALDDPRLRFPMYVAGALVAGGAWVFLLFSGLAPRTRRIAVFLGIAARVACLLTPPAHSDDVFRYLYEGRLVWEMGPLFPFTHAPANAIADGVPRELLDEAWLRINHPHIPTIYPPFAQIVFAIAAGRLWLLKILLVVAELFTFFVLSRAKKELWPILILCPLSIFEIAREGHADSLSMLGLAIGATAFSLGRERLGYSGFAIAALAKLNGLIAMIPAIRTTRRGLVFGLLLSAPIILPYALRGETALFTYASSWRSGDGVFSLVLSFSEMIIGGDYTHLGTFTLTRHQLARAFTAALLFAFASLQRRDEPIAARVAELFLFLLLIAPTLHPWYALWLLALVPFAGRNLPAIAALIVLVPLLHHPGYLELAEGSWRELWWVRALVHVPVWLFFGYALASCRFKKAS